MPYTQHLVPQTKRHRPIRSREDLSTHLLWALSVELSTVPPYLCALYSITDNTTSAYRLVRSVAVEEMLHMMLVANLLNSIGTAPAITPDLVPKYPGFMPHHAAGGPFIQLQALSPALARTVFMAIEQPEPSPRAPAEGDEYETIGQFYKAIELGFEHCVERYGEEGLFGEDTGYQRADTYFGSGGGRLFEVHDLRAAKRAITEITQQGEGATHPRPPLPGEEPFGGYDHYGMRSDGTYGPILGIPWELSHFRKFEALADGDDAVPATYPMAPNPSTEQLDGSLRRLSALFDGSYTLVLTALTTTFSSDAAPESFFRVAFALMRDVLPTLATLLLQTPLEPAADPTLGPTAGPAFEWREVELAALVDEAVALEPHPPVPGVTYGQLWQQSLGSVVEALRGAMAEPAGAPAAGRPR